MMKSVFNINMELDGLDGDFLVRLKREHKRRNLVDWKELEKRVSNGDKLDTADEATLSKLSAAHERTKKHDREHKRRKVVDRKDLEKRESNGNKLDTADEATLSKLTAAHESNKKHLLERHQHGVKKRWSTKEDSMLARLVGESNSTKTKWKELSCQMVDRTPKQCRDRYNNSLKPDGKKGQWTREEEENIIRMQAEFGNKWSKLSSGG
jgi:hypothetical protein